MESFFFFNDTATTEIYTLSLHDALPISLIFSRSIHRAGLPEPLSSWDAYAKYVDFAQRSGVIDKLAEIWWDVRPHPQDRKSTRLNSSHANISYAVFCLKKNQNLLFHTLL